MALQLHPVRKYIWIVLPVLCLMLIYSCSSKSEFAGIYRTERQGSEVPSEIELTAHGEGYWRVGDNEETFDWYAKGDQIRLNTKKGGVLVAIIRGNVLEITLSGNKKLQFVKKED